MNLRNAVVIAIAVMVAGLAAFAVLVVFRPAPAADPDQCSRPVSQRHGGWVC